MNIAPVFIKNEDLGRRMNEYEICSMVCKTIDPDDLFGCQRVGSLWRVYAKNDTAKSKLLTETVRDGDHDVPVYRENPFRTGATSPEEKLIRITVKELGVSTQDTTRLEQYLLKEGVTIAKKIDFAKVRDPLTGQLSSWFTGDRVVFAKDMKHPLPRFAQIGTATCRIFHDGQEVPQTKLCTNCFGTDHTRGACKKPQACACCKKPGHIAGDKQCEAYLSKGHSGTAAVHGEENPLSNMYPCTIKVFGKEFNSTEQAYQYSKAIRRGQLDVATGICAAPTPFMAKKQAKFLKYDKNWNETEKITLMNQLLQEKLDQVPEFKTALLDSGRKMIVETVPGEYVWSSGLNEKVTNVTKRKFWPGSNLLGKLLEELRSSMTKR